MAETLPSPPATPTPTPGTFADSDPDSNTPATTAATTQADLVAQLDDLLASYLNLLDTYTNLRSALSKDLSSGFFSLAQANRAADSTLGTGRRYGEEGYDARMKALRRVRVRASRPENGAEGHLFCRKNDEPESEREPELEPELEPEPEPDHKKEENGKQDLPRDEHSHSEPQKDMTPDPSLPPSTTSDASSNLRPPSYAFTIPHQITTTSSPSTNIDPLKWYGILHPATLGAAQSHFASAVSTTLPQLLTTVSSMHALESDIWHVRRQLDLLDDYDYDYDYNYDSVSNGEDQSQVDSLGSSGNVGATFAVGTVSGRSKPAAPPTSSKSPSSSRKPSLVSRSSQPRPRVLKLD